MPFQAALEEVHLPVKDQCHDVLEAGGPLVVGDILQLEEELAYVGVEVVSFAGVAGAVDPRGTSQRIHLQARVVREAVAAQPLVQVLRFLDGILFQGVARLRDLFVNAQVVGRQEFELFSQDFPGFAEFPAVGRRKNDFHKDKNTKFVRLRTVFAEPFVRRLYHQPETQMIMKRITILLTVLSLCGATGLYAQTKNFELGKWTEIQNAILKELNRSYVDSLPVGRIERAGIDAMLEELDPYTIYIPEEETEDLQMMLGKTYGGIGAIIFKPEKDGPVYINEPYAGSPAVKGGLVCGDEILEIDGVSVAGLETKECSDRMKGKPGTPVRFKVRKVRGGQVEDVTIVRERIHLPDVEYAAMLDDTTGYILQTGFTEKVSNDVRAALLSLKDQGMKRLVLDLRGNGGGLLSEAVGIVSLFVPKGSVVVTARNNQGQETAYKTTFDPVDTELPVIVLVDSGTASSSEIVSGALQDYDRATIMGRRTYGKGLVQSMRPLPYNGTMKVTTAKYYTPSGRCVQAIDYSHRNEDGSVGHIPDSLTTEFKTAHGRTVRDGGGITPDIELPVKDYSRLVYSLVYGGILEQYALHFVRSHESIPAVADFHFCDADYEDFIAFAKDKTFDYRSSARTYFDQMKKELEKDGLAEAMTDRLAAVEKALDMDKEAFLRLKKDEILPFIEEEIAVRYFYQEAGIQVRLRYDDQLKKALATPLLSF